MTPPKLKALLWDVDGTLAETERDGHLPAFNLAFQALGVAWRWDAAHYGDLLRVTGGRERLLHDMSLRADAPASMTARATLAAQLHERKNAVYAELVRAGAIALREGVADLLAQCRACGVQMGIATTTSRSNVDALLSVHLGERWVEQFAAIVCGDDVQHKKPDPEVYLRSLRTLGVSATEALALEDSPAGVAAARAAGVAVIVTRSAYFADVAIEGALAIGPGLHQRRGWHPALPPRPEHAASVELADLQAWHRRAGGACQPM